MSSDTLKTPALMLDFRSWTVRKEATPAGVRVFLNIMEKWNVCPEDARSLLHVSSRYYGQLKARPEGWILGTDRPYQISYLICIFKALNILYGSKLVDEFVQLPNTNRLFQGSTPLSYMIEGGLSAMQNVRRLLDSRAAGNS